MTDATAEIAATPRSEHLPFWRKAAYAIGDLGNSAGLSILIGKLWDAVNDPLVGWLSDRTRTHWGRRRPYLLFGAVPK